MTCGIYIMLFNGLDQVYIGQSRDIDKRKKQHLSLFKSGKASHKLMCAYKTYGLPSIELLEECSEEMLDSLEKYYISEFDSVNNGLNTRSTPTSGGVNCYGELNGRSKFSNEQIIKALFTLIDCTELKYRDVAEITGISRSMVVDIASGNSHKWLEKEYPNEYAILLSLVGNRAARNYSTVKSPEGVIHKVNNLSAFCKVYGLDTGNFSKLLRRKKLSYNGWTLAE